LQYSEVKNFGEAQTYCQTAYAVLSEGLFSFLEMKRGIKNTAPD
jgi:hypothetical protein